MISVRQLQRLLTDPDGMTDSEAAELGRQVASCINQYRALRSRLCAAMSTAPDHKTDYRDLLRAHLRDSSRLFGTTPGYEVLAQSRDQAFRDLFLITVGLDPGG